VGRYVANLALWLAGRNPTELGTITPIGQR
jgi:hypothetical protein